MSLSTSPHQRKAPSTSALQVMPLTKEGSWPKEGVLQFEMLGFRFTGDRDARELGVHPVDFELEAPVLETKKRLIRTPLPSALDTLEGGQRLVLP